MNGDNAAQILTNMVNNNQASVDGDGNFLVNDECSSVRQSENWVCSREFSLALFKLNKDLIWFNKCYIRLIAKLIWINQLINIFFINQLITIINKLIDKARFKTFEFFNFLVTISTTV